MQRQHNEINHLAARQFATGAVIVGMDQALSFAQNAVKTDLKSLAKHGLGMDADHLHAMAERFQKEQAKGLGMDAALTAPLTTASVTTPVQFLQHWLPGAVNIVTAARRIDNLVGITVQGNWHDEEIVQSVLEHTGEAQLYSDFTQTPYTNWNLNFEERTIVRFEDGMQVGTLEEARAGAVRQSASANKRAAAMMNLEIRRNQVGFLGFDGGNNRTYGFLNDPDLPAYTNLVAGAGGNTTFASKTFLEIVRDLRSAAQALRTQSQEKVDPKKDQITLAIATDSVDYLTVVSDFGNSVNDWIKENYPNWRVESAPELNDANGGDNVFYLYSETVNDSGSDDQRTFIQVVPTKFQTLGVDQRSKSYEESYSNATAGIMVKRPYAIVRRSGC